MNTYINSSLYANTDISKFIKQILQQGYINGFKYIFYEPEGLVEENFQEILNKTINKYLNNRSNEKQKLLAYFDNQWITITLKKRYVKKYIYMQIGPANKTDLDYIYDQLPYLRSYEIFQDYSSNTNIIHAALKLSENFFMYHFNVKLIDE